MLCIFLGERKAASRRWEPMLKLVFRFKKFRRAHEDVFLQLPAIEPRSVGCLKAIRGALLRSIRSRPHYPSYAMGPQITNINLVFNLNYELRGWKNQLINDFLISLRLPYFLSQSLQLLEICLRPAKSCNVTFIYIKELFLLRPCFFKLIS